MELDEVIVIRCGFENRINRVNKRSVGYSSLAKEYYHLKDRSTPLFKNEAIYLPIIHSWRTKGNTFIGTAILSGFDDDHVANGQKHGGGSNSGSSKLANGSLLREIMDQMSFFANICILDMSYRKKDDNFKAMSNMSNPTSFPNLTFL